MELVVNKLPLVDIVKAFEFEDLSPTIISWAYKSPFPLTSCTKKELPVTPPIKKCLSSTEFPKDVPFILAKVVNVPAFGVEFAAFAALLRQILAELALQPLNLCVPCNSSAILQVLLDYFAPSLCP